MKHVMFPFIRRHPLALAACVAALLALLALPAAHVLAGVKTPEVVTIDTVGRVAQGSFGSTRASGNSVDYIGCWSRSNVPLGTEHADGDLQGGCEARQRVSSLVTRSISCTFPSFLPTTQSYVWVLGAMSTDAHIKFTWSVINGVNVCQIIRISNFSHTRPKT